MKRSLTSASHQTKLIEMQAKVMQDPSAVNRLHQLVLMRNLYAGLKKDDDRTFMEKHLDLAKKELEAAVRKEAKTTEYRSHIIQLGYIYSIIGGKDIKIRTLFQERMNNCKHASPEQEIPSKKISPARNNCYVLKVPFSTSSEGPTSFWEYELAPAFF